MRQTATQFGLPRSAAGMLQHDFNRVSAKVDALDFKLKRAQQIPHPGRRKVAERMVHLEMRQLRDQLRNIGEMQAILRRREG